MAAAPRDRLAPEREAGFSLIELVVVLVVLGALLALAFPSYVGFKAHATRTTAAANLRELVPALEAYKADTGSYRDLTLTVLKTRYQLNIDDSPGSPYGLFRLGDDSYCVQYRDGDSYAVKNGPAAAILSGQGSGC